jgi:hypothetical protein
VQVPYNFFIASIEVQLNTTSLVFDRAIGERCVIATVANGDSSNMGNRSYSLILERSSQMSTVPVEIYPNTVPIIVVDDDPGGNFVVIINRFHACK